MTINGPAPTILAMFLNTAIDQHPELDRAEVLRRVRGTVQADILKEDQGQNTCIFSTEFSLGLMADIQEWFVEHEVRSFYSVSISGYHIAEAGANPLSQLAFTLANGFTYVESYLARGLDIDDFAPNLSFFFSNGMDPEYAVLGRVARRIWAVAMRDRYGAGRAQPEAQVPRPDLGPVAARPGDGLQRHPHHPPGPDRAVRQRQQPPHQRLRRSGHHPDRRVGAARAGHPADHQPRVGPLDEREPQPGQLHHRAAHRPRRGGRARRARAHLRARRRARGHGDRVPAGPDPGRVDEVRARKHDGTLPHHRGQHVPRTRTPRRTRHRP